MNFSNKPKKNESFEPIMGRIKGKEINFQKKKKDRIQILTAENGPRMGQKCKFFQPKCLISKGISNNLTDHQNIQNIIKFKMQNRFPDSQRN